MESLASNDTTDVALLVTQLVDLVIVKPEVVGDLVQHGGANLLALFVGVGKILEQRLREHCNCVWENGRVKAGAIRQRKALEKPIQRVVLGVESGIEKKLFPRPPLDHDFDVVQLLTKLLWELVENAHDFFPDFVFIHR